MFLTIFIVWHASCYTQDADVQEDTAHLKGKRMDTESRQFKDSGERLSALVLAAAATFLVFAAINAGFTPHATDLAGRILVEPTLSL